ncbi:glutamate-5-semialdehyde dehydrogenase [Yersinia massiliensis]|uniref:Gamma-glutamyl phosphate reductase n=1 Tax=Yersinia massiliensis TaxID=419257 RepID=A0AA90Y6E5_9GAMM|nr:MULTISPECIES: glutamate-5-semialdehyde dehydrogenase [Yersinia]HEI6964047.1 glutamate-5-semialdehyde dehydrogenase [Yersinia enterocolitica]MCB5320020.1 glutamate-5-semialdehyde dehydrogenase [Yersinia massiliensis]MDA5548138.1 glutamate-5-semialdehyde dehydrogenase [Yersinia massiliensis]NIL25706.1 glutamate-5-semialdehyde dehydrogenase [Yersinia massiliensis]UZM81313.1 glutamate-5-semialdehyde dehydrogenase [Yersinia massiliensis]
MLEQMGKAAKQASWQLAMLSTAEKNQALAVMANLLESESQTILQANEQDMIAARKSGMSEALLDRLLLSPARLAAIANDVRQVCRLNDPVGRVIDGSLLDSGLKLERRRVPLGVIGVIYEARPNVTIDVASLCLKTGNAVILRGGKETHHTNQATVKVIQQALEQCGLPAAAVQAIESPDRELVNELLRMDRYVDMLIPRGGAGLHKLCREQSTIPVITGGIGVCHTFVDESADFEKALLVIENAKVQRPSACNSLETLLVHQAIAKEFLPVLSDRMHAFGVTLHASPQAMPYLAEGKANLVAVEAVDYDDEWLSLDLNVDIVTDIDSAIAHIREHGTSHSDAILTRSLSSAEHFVRAVDSSAVYVNASTRFTDGGQFGLGAEVAVSTQKLHARGPMGLDALTTYKWIGYGDDLVRS